MTRSEPHTPEALVQCLRDARARTLALIAERSDEELLGPRLAIVNPLLWEVGHVGWFQERWCLRRLRGHAPLEAHADELYDSIAIAHDVRWDLPLLTRAGMLAYIAAVLERVEAELAAGELDREARDLHLLALFHEDMHAEAFVYTHQTHGWPAPRCAPAAIPGGGPLPGDAEVPGGTRLLGAAPGPRFRFDNEEQAHEVEVRPFRLSRAPVTQSEFLGFVEERGYERDELWTREGRAWRQESGARHPVHWRSEGPGRWLRRSYDAWVPLEEHLPVHHVNAHEADAFCRWAGRRLPSEAEWERAAGPARHPWGDEDAEPWRAHLDLCTPGCAEVGAYPAGDGPHGHRQLCGNVWEWTASVFAPYPGFRPGAYAEYSEPWFGTHRVLRGGAFATRARLLRNSWRNFYTPDRRDVLAGFRTAAREE